MPTSRLPPMADLIENYSQKLRLFAQQIKIGQDADTSAQQADHSPENAADTQANSAGETTLAEVTYDLLRIRDQIEQHLTGPNELDGKDFTRLYEGDAHFFRGLKQIYAMRRSLGFSVDQWRYTRHDIDRQHWWWFNPGTVQRSDDRFISQQNSPWRIAAVLIVIVAIVLLIVSAVGFVGDEQVLAAAISVVVQLVAGGFLFSSYTAGLARSIGHTASNFVNFFSSIFGITQRDSLHEQPMILPQEARFLGSALVILALVVLLPTVLRWGAGQLFTQAVRTVEDGINLNEGAFYLDIYNRLDPNNAEAATNLAQLGLLYQEIGDMERAASIYEQAIQYDSRIVLAVDQLAEYLIDTEDYDRAIALENHALRLLAQHRDKHKRLPISDAQVDQWYHRVLVTRGRAYLNLQQPGVAIRDFSEAIDFAQNESPQLFINPIGAGTPPSGPNAISTLEAYFRRGAAFLMRAQNETCSPDDLADARSDFSATFRFPQTAVNLGDELAWRETARRAWNLLSDEDCDTIKERNLSWLTRIAL